MAPSLAAKAVAGGFGGGTAFLEALWMATTETAPVFSLDDERVRGPGCSAAGASAAVASR